MFVTYEKKKDPLTSIEAYITFSGKGQTQFLHVKNVFYLCRHECDQFVLVKDPCMDSRG